MSSPLTPKQTLLGLVLKGSRTDDSSDVHLYTDQKSMYPPHLHTRNIPAWLHLPLAIRHSRLIDHLQSYDLLCLNTISISTKDVHALNKAAPHDATFQCALCSLSESNLGVTSAFISMHCASKVTVSSGQESFLSYLSNLISWLLTMNRCMAVHSDYTSMCYSVNECHMLM